MITLDFTFDADASGPGGPWSDFWVDEIQVGSFEGYQTIIVNEMDFSCALPILGFARTLRAIANALVKDPTGDEQYRDLSSIWALNFRANGKDVEISDHRGEASVPLEKLRVSAQRYADYVWECCCELCPDISENEFVVAWFNDDDYSVLTLEPKKTDRSTLTPSNRFYKKPD